MPQQLTTELPAAPEPAWKTAHELRLEWSIFMGGSMTVRASYTVPARVFDKISRDYGLPPDVRNRLFVLLVEGGEFRAPPTWRSKNCREYFNNRIHFFAPNNVRAVAASLEIAAQVAALAAMPDVAAAAETDIPL